MGLRMDSDGAPMGRGVWKIETTVDDDARRRHFEAFCAVLRAALPEIDRAVARNAGPELAVIARRIQDLLIELDAPDALRAAARLEWLALEERWAEMQAAVDRLEDTALELVSTFWV